MKEETACEIHVETSGTHLKASQKKEVGQNWIKLALNVSIEIAKSQKQQRKLWVSR